MSSMWSQVICRVVVFYDVATDDIISMADEQIVNVLATDRCS